MQKSREQHSKEFLKKIIPLFEAGKKVEICPRGTSMYPLLTGKESDRVILSKVVDPKLLRKNDIALYQRQGGLLVLHRICRITPEGFYFVGDNQTEVEGPLPAESVLAVTEAICRHGKWFSAKNPLYRICSRIWLFLRPVRPLISRPLGSVYRSLSKRRSSWF